MSKFSEILNKIPVYQNLYGKLLSGDISDKDLEKLPELTKGHVSKEFPSNWMTDDLQISMKNNEYELMTTSGTSNERTQLIRPKNWWYGEEQRLYKYLKNIAPEYTDMSSKAILTTAICSNTLCYKEAPPYEKRIVNGILHLNITPDPNLWTKADIQRISEEIDKFQPQCLQADPVYLAIFIKFLKKYNIPSPQWTPKLLIFTYEYLPKKCLKIIKTLWQTPSIIIYGTTETGFIFHQCPNGKFHSIPDSVQLLFKPIGHHSNICELLITSFRNPYMPFINYNTKDLLLVNNAHQHCSCGCNGIIIDQLMGRTKDITASSTGKSITVGDIDNTLSITENNIVIYSLDFSFHSKIIFRYTTFDDSPLSEPQQAKIIESLQELYENAYIIELNHEKEIKPALSGKFEIIKRALSNV